MFLMDTLMDRMGVQPILPVEVSVAIETMLNFDGDFVKLADSDATCKQTLRYRQIDSVKNLDGEIRMIKSLPGKSVPSSGIYNLSMC